MEITVEVRSPPTQKPSHCICIELSIS
uniref:Uncharacterized protein n=1 Tax=Arundo donax TaxID=35708 RepID=A0A0A9FXD6_ARUDO